MRRILLSSLLVLGMTSCESSVKDISIVGLVVNSHSRQRIKNAHVVILCWKPSDFGCDDIDYKKIELTTDQNGKFATTFERGIRLDLAVKAEGYEITKLSIPRLSKRNIDATITMKSLDRIVSQREVGTTRICDSLFVGFRDYHLSSGKSTLTFGIDIQRGSTTNNKDEADLWAIRSKKDIYPSILITPEKGGLIPIYEKDIKVSLMFEKTSAPNEGYIDYYKLKGNEAGFFIKSKDGSSYGKLIIIPVKTEISSPYKDSYYEEHRLTFRLVYQPNGTNDLYVPQSDIDLEQYLLDTLDK
ncbi:MAG: hypothetical protein ACREBU_24860 [Nitrososphaera sp.]